jgi:uncharacterized protein
VVDSGDTLSLTIHDLLHSDEEDRFILIENKIRIISARKATKKESKQYEENAKR